MGKIVEDSESIISAEPEPLSRFFVTTFFYIHKLVNVVEMCTR